MKVGLWAAPAVLVGLAAFLWVATWLDRLIQRPTLDVPLVADLGPTGGPHG